MSDHVGQSADSTVRPWLHTHCLDDKEREAAGRFLQHREARRPPAEYPSELCGELRGLVESNGARLTSVSTPARRSRPATHLSRPGDHLPHGRRGYCDQHRALAARASAASSGPRNVSASHHWRLSRTSSVGRSAATNARASPSMKRCRCHESPAPSGALAIRGPAGHEPLVSRCQTGSRCRGPRRSQGSAATLPPETAGAGRCSRSTARSHTDVRLPAERPARRPGASCPPRRPAHHARRAAVRGARCPRSIAAAPARRVARPPGPLGQRASHRWERRLRHRSWSGRDPSQHLVVRWSGVTPSSPSSSWLSWW